MMTENKGNKDVEEHLKKNPIVEDAAGVPAPAGNNLPVGSRPMAVRGLEGIPVSDVPLPFMKLVHPTTTNAVDAKGNPVVPGKFYNTSTAEVMDELDFSILAAKKGEQAFTDKKTGEEEIKPAYKVVGVQEGKDKPFLMIVTGTSYWGFRNLLGKIDGAGVKDVWMLKLVAKSEQREGDFGNYLSTVFSVSEDEHSQPDLDILEGLYLRYGGAVNRGDEEPEEVEKDEQTSREIPF